MADPMSVFQVAGRAMSAQLVRMNTTASNLANAGGTTGSAETAYKTMKPVFRTSFDAASGLATVDVEKIVTAGEAPTKVYDPNNPLADEQGMVRMPDLDMGEQMSSLVMAQRGFQASVQVTKTAQDSYASALQIGRA